MVGKKILFLCDRNTVRSPMAASLLAAGSPQRDDLVSKSDQITSAGLHADDNTVDPFAAAVMSEIGLDITHHTPRTTDPETLTPETHVIALSLPAFEAARDWRRNKRFELDYWSLPAVPSLDAGREAILDGFRSIREALKLHIANRFAKP